MTAGTQAASSLTGTEQVVVDGGGAVILTATVNQIAGKLVKGSGTFVANGATPVVVANTAITANSAVIFGLKTIGGTPAGAPFMTAVTAATGFSVAAVAGDTSTYNYKIIG